MELVKMENVTKIYGDKENKVLALHNVNLSIEKGSVVSVVGASGSGKSTLLNIMGGVDTPSDGVIYVDGKEITKLSDDELKERLDEEQKNYILKEKIKLIKEEINEVDIKDNDIEKLNIKISEGN